MPPRSRAQHACAHREREQRIQRGDEVVVAGLAPGQAQVLRHGRVEDVRVLRQRGDDLAHVVVGEVGQVGAVERDRPLVVEEAQQPAWSATS